MPLLDVSELVSDPDFADTFTVVRSIQTVTSGGLEQPTTQTFSDLVGVVLPEDNSLFEALAEGRVGHGSITIRAKFAFSSGDAGTQPDVVIWHGRQYTVKDVGDYAAFGQGFTYARCELLDTNAPAAS